ncbi:MAG: SMC-Scp complex subunit ScpB [Mesorhizobium sp.]|nr:MAG: SMC-Scp complex subunit ScpB [Mesorhizobium sp.]
MSQASVRRKPDEQPALLDSELEHLPPELRWREWMGRVEAVIFAASEPVPREVLARVVGKNCHAAFGTPAGEGAKELSQAEALVLMCIAYFQPITRGELSSFFGKEVSRDLIGVLRGQELIASGPRSPQPGAPYTYVTTKNFLSQYGLDTLRQLPDFEALEDAGLLSKEKLLTGNIIPGFSNDGDGDSGVAGDE